MYKKLQAKNLLCTGCGACANKCANDAIEYIYNYVLYVCKVTKYICNGKVFSNKNL